MGWKNNVLLLNQDYSPISLCNTERAFILVYLNKAELIAEDTSQQLRSVSQSFSSPTIVRLMQYARTPFRHVQLNKYNIFRRDNHTCQYCGSKNQLTLDHIIPKSRGGDSSWLNLITACTSCNNKKGNKTPKEANMKLLTQPHKPSYFLFLKELSGKFIADWEPYLKR